MECGCFHPLISQKQDVATFPQCSSELVKPVKPTSNFFLIDQSHHDMITFFSFIQILRTKGTFEGCIIHA